MIGALHQVQRRASAQLGHERSEQVELGELIASALYEEHRDADIQQMRRTVGTGPTRRMQWKGEEHESSNLRKGRLRLRLGRHSTAERSAARDEGQARCQS